MDKLKQFWQWLVGAAVLVLGAIFLTRRSGQGHEQSATRSEGAAAEHKEMAGIALEQAKSETKTADQQHELAEQAAKIENREAVTVPEAVRRAKKGWTA